MFNQDNVIRRRQPRGISSTGADDVSTNSFLGIVIPERGVEDPITKAQLSDPLYYICQWYYDEFIESGVLCRNLQNVQSFVGWYTKQWDKKYKKFILILNYSVFILFIMLLYFDLFYIYFLHLFF